MSHTTVYDAATGFEEFATYTDALVKLAEGPPVTAKLTDIDLDHVEIGQEAEMVTSKRNTDGAEGMRFTGINLGRRLLRK